MELIVNDKTINKNIIYKDFGIFLKTENGEIYELKNVIIFKDNEVKIIANYFLDNFIDKMFEVNGEIKRKIKVDLSANYNFVVKAKKDFSFDDTTYNLYINGDLNNYINTGLSLVGKRLDINYKLNNFNCSQCIGWNEKESNNAKYHDFENAYKKINCYSIDNEDMEKYIKDLSKAYKKYKKALEIEKTYTAKDYLKMQLASGTTEEENKTMLKNNGFEI